MIFFNKPDGFKVSFEVVSCFLECRGEILLLLRQKNKPQGGTWGVPAGKINGSETPLQAIKREMREETGFVPKGDIIYHKNIFVSFPDYDFIYHIFSLPIAKKPRVAVNLKEHEKFAWKTPWQTLQMPLIQDLDSCIKLFYRL
jgi:8-oxo-dGTP pyrophosphatase MutT (NUDIX family)